MMEAMNNPAAIIEPYRDQTGGTISALRALVLANGYIRDVDQQAVAELFNISRAEVRGIVSFYSDLRTNPPANKIIKVCQAEACQASGCRSLTAALENRLDIVMGEPTPDNEFALESVYCLGHCANGPTALIDGNVCTNLSSADVDALINGNPDTAPTEIVETNNRLIFNRCGRVDPLDFDAYRADGGFSKAPTSAESVLAELRSSGLRGRGGAGFPA
jgi:formate dehydrogenase subunit gamma